MRGQNGFDNVCKIQQRVIDLNPNLAQELCFLEIRQLSMKVKTVQKLENIQDDEILTIYSQDFLVQINLWSNLAVSASVKHQGPIRDALVQLILNTIKISSHLKYHPFHLHLFDLLNFLGKNGGDVFIPVSQYIVSPFTVSNQAYFAKIGHSPVASDESADEDIFFKSANFFSHATKEKILRDSLQALSVFIQHIVKNVSFPELIIPIQNTLQNFVRNCETQKYSKIA